MSRKWPAIRGLFGECHSQRSDALRGIGEPLQPDHERPVIQRLDQGVVWLHAAPIQLVLLVLHDLRIAGPVRRCRSSPVVLLLDDNNRPQLKTPSAAAAV